MGGSLLNWNTAWRKNGPRFDLREATPHERPQDVYLYDRRVSVAGVFDYECWLDERRGQVSFSFFHHKEFQEKFVIAEKSFATPEATRNWFKVSRQHDSELDALVAKRYCAPVIARTEAFRKLQINEVQGIRRQRGDERYMIYLQSDSRACDDWHVVHLHAIRLVVFDPNNKICYEEEFGCEDVWGAVRRYHKILDRFDDFLMEQHL